MPPNSNRLAQTKISCVTCPRHLALRDIAGQMVAYESITRRKPTLAEIRAVFFELNR